MGEHVPTTGEVRAAYSQARCEFDPDRPEVEDTDTEFNRWLAAHDAAVKAEAWDEGYEAGFDDGEADAFNHVTFDEPCIETPNPYRADRIEAES